MRYKLSNRTKRELEAALSPHAAGELFSIINSLSDEVQRLSRDKVDVTRIAPVSADTEESPRYS